MFVCVCVCVWRWGERGVGGGASIILFCFLGGRFGDLSVNVMMIISECHTLFHQCNPFYPLYLQTWTQIERVPVHDVILKEVSKHVKRKCIHYKWNFTVCGGHLKVV